MGRLMPLALRLAGVSPSRSRAGEGTALGVFSNSSNEFPLWGLRVQAISRGGKRLKNQNTTDFNLLTTWGMLSLLSSFVNE